MDHITPPTTPGSAQPEMTKQERARKPYTCECGKKVPVRSKNYDDGVCFMCIRLDSRGGAYREYSRKKHRGLHAFKGKDGKTTHLG